MDTQHGIYADLKPQQIEAILKVSPIAYVPWGALEWHSNHAPIGLDSTKAYGICKAMAGRTGGVVLPVIPFGVNTIKPYKGFPHCIDISPGLAARVAEELCLQLADEGFQIIIIFTGHYPPEQLEALQLGVDQAGAILSHGYLEVWSDLQFLEGSFQADHAGATETSFQMYLEPGSVDLAALPSRSLTLDDDGVTGEDPREASPVRGAQQMECVVQGGIARIRFIQDQLNSSQ